MEAHEEDLVVARSTKSDTVFDSIIGHIEDIIMEEDFQNLQTTFMERYYLEFEDTEENKLSYTDIHKQYTDLIEKYITDQLTERMPNFVMADFQAQLMQRNTELEGEVFEMLVTFSDFLAFKEMMIDYRTEKEGRGIDLGMGFTITSLGASMNGAGPDLCVSGSTSEASGLCVSGNSTTHSNAGNHIDLVDPEEAMVEGGNTPRFDGQASLASGVSSNGSGKQEDAEHMDIPSQ